MYAILCTAALMTPVAEDKTPDARPTDPVTIKLVARQTTYKLDLGGKTGKEFQAYLKDVQDGKVRGRIPPAPAVDLVLEIVNNTDKEVKVWTGGDPVQIHLELKGPGAVSIRPGLAFTTDFRGPVPSTIAAGKKFEMPISRLTHGFRGASMYSYWTEPGEYTLSATLNTGISPAPKGSKEQDGFGVVKLTSSAIKIKVEK